MVESIFKTNIRFETTELDNKYCRNRMAALGNHWFIFEILQKSADELTFASLSQIYVRNMAEITPGRCNHKFIFQILRKSNRGTGQPMISMRIRHRIENEHTLSSHRSICEILQKA